MDGARPPILWPGGRTLVGFGMPVVFAVGVPDDDDDELMMFL